MITCRELTDFLIDYVDDELPATERASFEGHLTRCRSCVDFLESYRTTVELARELGNCDPAAASPQELPEELIQAIVAARRKSST